MARQLTALTNERAWVSVQRVSLPLDGTRSLRQPCREPRSALQRGNLLDATHCHRVEGFGIDENKAPGILAVFVAVQRDRTIESQRAVSHLVWPDRIRRDGAPRIEIDNAQSRFDARRGGAGCELEQISLAALERPVFHPEDARVNPLRHRGRPLGFSDDIAARGIQRVRESQSHGAPGRGVTEIAVEGDDPRDTRDAAGRKNLDRHADTHLAARDQAAIAAEIRIGPVDPLDRHAERIEVRGPRRLHGFEIVEQRRPAIPRQVFGTARDVIAAFCRDRNARDVDETEVGRQFAEGGFDRAECVARPADAIHLVDGEHDMADAEHRQDHEVAFGLAGQAFLDGDQDEREIGDGSAGRHVGGIFLVPGRIDDDELAARRREEAIGNVDRDVLLALGRQSVQQQREIERVALRAELAGIGHRARRAGRQRLAWSCKAAGRSASTCRGRPSRKR